MPAPQLHRSLSSDSIDIRFCSLFACHIYPREAARIFLYFIPDIRTESRGGNRARERKGKGVRRGGRGGEKILSSIDVNDPYNARLARFIAPPAGVSKGMAFRKITSSNDVDDGFIGRRVEEDTFVLFYHNVERRIFM